MIFPAPVREAGRGFPRIPESPWRLRPSLAYNLLVNALITRPARWAAALLLALLGACAIPTAPQSQAPASSRPTSPADPAATPPAPPPTSPLPAVTAEPPAAVPEIAELVLGLVNAERSGAGCPPLALEGRLGAAAQGHSDDMAANDFMDHTGSDGSQAGDRARAASYDWRGIGENVAAGHRTPAEVVAGWMASPGHRSIILTCAYVDAGVGYSYSPAAEFGHYWTLLLAN